MKKTCLVEFGVVLLVAVVGLSVWPSSVAAGLPDQQGDSQTQAEILFEEGRALFDAGMMEAAVEKFEAALVLFRQSDDLEMQAFSLLFIGFARQQQRDYGGALEALEASLPAWQAVGNPVGEGVTTSTIGQIYFALGQYELALDAHQRAIEIARAIPDPKSEGIRLNNLASVYGELGQYDLALEKHQQALTLAVETSNRASQAKVLNNIGLIHSDRGNYRQALNYYQQSLAVAQSAGDLAAVEGSALNNIGAVYDDLGQYDKALEFYDRSLVKRSEADDLEGEEVTLNNIGSIHNTQGDFLQALHYHQQALVIAKQINDLPGQSVALNNIGAVHEALGEYEQALDDFKQALSIEQQLGTRAAEGVTLDNIGTAYALVGQFDLALEQYRQALQISEDVGDRKAKVQTLSNLGALHVQLEREDIALDYYVQAIDAIESIASDIKVEELKASFAAQQISVYERLIDLLAESGRYQEAFNYAERARARAFLDQLAGGAVDFRSGADAVLLEEERALQEEIGAQRALLLRLQNLPSDERNQDAIDEARVRLADKEAAYAELLTRLKVQSPEVASMLSVDVASLAEVQALLDPNVTLVEYFVTEARTLAFVITGNSFDTITLDVSRPELRQVISAFRSFASRDDPHPASLQQLHAWLIAPLEAYLDTNAITIVPHNVLHYLPFVTLSDGQRYLGNDYVLTKLPNASMLRFLDKPGVGAGTVLALGNPSIEAALPALRFAQQEAEAIAGLYGSQALVGPKATESAVWVEAGQASILHLAAHGEYNKANPLFTTLHLAPDGDNDGRLEVYEIYELNLRTVTDLVVLSACNTQVGALSSGDEVVGLNRAFLSAGAPSVIASLWNVDDRATGLLMEKFYSHLQEDLGKAEALRRAQAELRSQGEFAHPYFWAAFELTGDGGTVASDDGPPFGQASSEEVSSSGGRLSAFGIAGLALAVCIGVGLVTLVGVLVVAHQRR